MMIPSSSSTSPSSLSQNCIDANFLSLLSSQRDILKRLKTSQSPNNNDVSKSSKGEDDVLQSTPLTRPSLLSQHQQQQQPISLPTTSSRQQYVMDNYNTVAANAKGSDTDVYADIDADDDDDDDDIDDVNDFNVNDPIPLMNQPITELLPNSRDELSYNKLLHNQRRMSIGMGNVFASLDIHDDDGSASSFNYSNRNRSTSSSRRDSSNSQHNYVGLNVDDYLRVQQCFGMDDATVYRNREEQTQQASIEPHHHATDDLHHHFSSSMFPNKKQLRDNTSSYGKQLKTTDERHNKQKGQQQQQQQQQYQQHQQHQQQQQLSLIHI